MTITEAPPSRDLDIISDLRTLYLRARDDKRSRYDTWLRNYRLVNNRLGVGQTSNWMPAPRDSEIYPGLSSLVAWMTDQEVNIDLVPASDPSSVFYQTINKIADDLNDVLDTLWETESYDAQIKLALWDALQYGVGIFKCLWDNKLAGGYGNAALRRVDPWAFYVDPYATSLDDAEYFIETRKVSYEELQRRFPDTYHLVSTESSGLDSYDDRPKLFADASRQPRTNPGNIPTSGLFPGSSSAPGTWSQRTSRQRTTTYAANFILYEYWIRQNDESEYDWPDLEDEPEYSDNRVRDTWRLICMCNQEILLDVPATDLWSHGSHPYERMVFDDTGEFYGVSLVDHLAYPQIYINRLLTALQYNAELTGNPIFIEPANSGLNRIGIINRPGQRLTVHGPAAQNNRPDWLQPPQMPPQVMELVNFWIARIENTLGLSALQKGITPTQRNAEGALNMVQEAAFVRVRSAISNLQDTLQRCVVKLADLIVDNYTEPRVVGIIGEDGEMLAKNLAGRHFFVPSNDGMVPLKYVIRVEAGANGPTSRSARMNEANMLYGMGAVDDLYLLQKHRVRNPQTVLQRLYQKRQSGQMGEQKGKRPTPK